MFLVNSAWTNYSSSASASPFQVEIPESLADQQRDIIARGGGNNTSGGGDRRSGFSSDDGSGCELSGTSSSSVVDIFTYPFQQQQQRNSFNSNKMREIPMEDLEIAMKVVIVGNGSVGKSSMIQRFCRGIFTRDYKKTIGVDFLERILSVDDQPVRLMLWDTAGQEEFDAITRTYYRGANACVLACSITDKDSFLALPKWKNKVCRECGDVPMVIVANKVDLQKESVVDSAELEGMARSLGIPKLIKTSVKDDLNVGTVFSYLAQSYMHSILGQISGLDSHDPYIDPMMMNETNSLHAPYFPQHSPTNNKSSSQQQLQYHHQQQHQKGLITNGHINNSSNKKGSSNNNNQVALLNGNNKSNKTGKSLFRNPIILKSSQPINGTQQQSTPPTPSPPPNINNSNNTHNSGGGGFGGFFSSSKTKQNNNYNSNNHQQNNNYQQHAQHHNLFHRNNRSNKYPANVLPPPVALINGQMIHRPSPYAPFINGGHGGLASRDPRHWNDNIPFRLDLVKDRKRRKEATSCTIL